MRKALLIAAALAFLAAPAVAQDIAGLEDCTKTSGLDRRTGCLQSDVDVLTRMLNKASAEAQQKLAAANVQIGAQSARIAALEQAVAALKSRLDALEKADKGKTAGSAAPAPKP